MTVSGLVFPCVSYQMLASCLFMADNYKPHWKINGIGKLDVTVL